MKFYKILLVMLFLIPGTQAQQFKSDNAIPLDPAILAGELENGLKYFIRENKKPEQRAELRLVVNAGSILEDEDQQGLAHFVEHMNFNGTKNFEKNELVNYLESIGMKFGPDINAYTSFDETVYKLQLPTDDSEIMKKGFQILEDWAHNATFADEEIDKERGVIIEEWRLGRGASARMRDKQFPILFKNSHYAERLPIGKKEIIENFDYETLKRFYKDWYRPDLMAVIAVGDFDKDEIKDLITEHFSKLPNVQNERERELSVVPDHNEILFAIATDPEATGTGIQIYYKQDLNPQGTVGDFKSRLTEYLYNRMLSERFRELTLLPDPPFVTAYSSKGRFIRTKEFYYLAASVKDDELSKGLDVLLTEAERVKKHGFTETELERAKTEMLRNIQKSYDERDKSPSSKYAEEYIRHFLVNEPSPGIEYEYELQKEIIPSITLEEVNSLAKEWVTKSNCVVMIGAPEKENLKLPSEKELLAVFNNVEKKNIEPYVDNFSDEPLLKEIPSPGSIVDEKTLPELNITEWDLSNGVKVVLKPTDFKNDEILLRGTSKGGNSLVSDDDYIAAMSAGQLINQSGIAGFNSIELKKKLAGKVVNAAPYITRNSEGITGSASIKDVKTMFELVYLYFTQPQIDSTAYLSYISKIRTMVENREKSPDAAFQDTLSLTLSQYHPRTYPWTTGTLSKMDMNKSFEIYKDRFADASDFTFIIVGSFKPEEIKPLVETYIANLPSIKRQETYKDVGINYPKGVIKKELNKGLEQKSYVNVTFTGPYEWSKENSYMLSSMTSAIRIKLREILREDKGGTYGVKVTSYGDHEKDGDYELNIYFGCDPDRVDELTTTLFAQIDSFRTVAMDNSYIDKVKEIQRRQNELEKKENDYWLKTLQSYYFYNMDLEEITKEDERIENLTSADVLEAAKKYINKDNYVSVILYPEQNNAKP